MLACVSPTSQMDQSEEAQNVYQTPSTTSSSAPKYGTMIPSRIFVGGIDFKVRRLRCQLLLFLFRQQKRICATFSQSTAQFEMLALSAIVLKFPRGKLLITTKSFIWRTFQILCVVEFNFDAPGLLLHTNKENRAFCHLCAFLFLQFFSIV